MLPEIDIERTRRWAAVRVPVPLQDQVRIEVDIDHVSMTIVECRAPWREGEVEWSRRPVARLRYTKTRNQWTLYCFRSSGNQERFEFAPPTPLIEELLDVLDDDPTYIFWG